MNTLTRRRLLSLSGRLAAASPFLPAARALAATPGPFARPRNLLLVFHPNGLEDGWAGDAVTGPLRLSPVLESFAPFRDRMLVVHGLHAGIRSEIRAHSQGMTSLWTGAQILTDDAYSAHPSVDQLIAEQLPAPLTSLELGVQTQVGFGAGGNASVMIYTRAGKAQPEDDPRAAFERLFGASLSAEERAATRARRRSVLDFVRADLARVRAAGPREAQDKLDAHLEGLRRLELRLDALGEGTCGRDRAPRRLSAGELQAHERFPELAELQSDVASLALACGVTRVVSLQLSNSVSDRRIPGVNPNAGVHTLMHTGTNAERVLINRYFAGRVAALLGKLAAVTRPDGTSLLDETLVVWGSEMAVGNHLRNPVPFVVAGGPRDGYFDQGKLLALRDPHRTTQLLVSVAHAFGLERLTQLGDLDDALSRGPLPGARRGT